MTLLYFLKNNYFYAPIPEPEGFEAFKKRKKKEKRKKRRKREEEFVNIAWKLLIDDDENSN